MTTRTQTVLDVFRDTVPTSFGFLASEHGFTLTRDDDYSFTASSPNCEITIELDWGSVAVSVRPVATGRSVRLSFIVGAVDADILFLPRYPWGPEEASEEVERQADLVRRYCSKILGGDLSDWASLEEHQEQVLEQWRRESERLVHEARVKLVRRRAETAFEEKRFSEAAQLLASIAGDLSDAERRMLDYARRRVILQPVPRRPRLEGIA